MGVKRVDKTRKVFAFVWWLISKEVDLFLFLLLMLRPKAFLYIL
jgi:hypothetical protein